MEDITIEKKLQLVQQIKNQYHQNQYDMAKREQILYGNGYRQDYYDQNIKTPEENDVSSSGSLRLRAFLAGLLLAGVILCDRLGISPAGMEMNQVFQLLSVDYQENVDEFISTLSQQNITP